MSFWRVIGWRDRCLGLARRCVLGSVVASGLAWGQTAPPGGRATLDSGGTNVFQVATVPLVVRDETTSGLVRFRVGFATEEAAAAGGLFDAAAVRLTRFAGDSGGLVGVFDSVGTLWRPANDGGLEVGSAQLTVKTVPTAGWLDASPFEGLTLRVAYEEELVLDRRRQVFEVARVPGARFFQLEAGEDRVSAPRIGAVERSGDNGWELRWEER